MKRLILLGFLLASGSGLVEADVSPVQSPADGTGNSAQGGKTLQADKPALQPVTDTPGLPRVLLIGDSISIGYTLPVRQDLAGVANVHRPPTNCGDTKRGLANLSQWLGDGKWDVIHFNWGLHDCKIVPATRLQNDLPAAYEQNLRAIVAQLKATGAILIFATTTPVPKDDNSPWPHSQTDVVAYNEIATRVMKENGVRIDDLYTIILPHEVEDQIPHNVHFKPAGWQILGTQVASSIRDALAVRNATPSPSPSAK